jgi:hypothetical protein
MEVYILISFGLFLGELMGSCKYSKEPTGFVKFQVLPDKLGVYYFSARFIFYGVGYIEK